MMRVVTVLIWSMLISTLISYVLTSMAGTDLNLSYIFILGIIFTVSILLLGSGLREEN